jgi:DNA-binding GntR family transcriptional regulator
MVKHDLTKGKKTDQQATIRKGGGLLNQEQTQDTVANGYEVLENVSKSSLKRIEMSALPKQKPDFDLPGATKDGLIAEWLKDWISNGLASGDLNESHLLPRKADIAKYLAVSVGTVQNAIRFIEDEGYVESKQRIGTIISNPERTNSRLRKLTSKRDQAVVAVKKLILDRNIQPSEALPSAREVARIIGSAPNTTRLALEFLASQGIVENRGARGNKANWFLHTIPVMGADEIVKAIESDTLIDQVERDLKKLIADNFQVGEKLPSHLELAETLKVSIKTVHDAMCRITEQGIVQSKRGRYGTYILRMPDMDKLFSTEEAASIFMPAQEAMFYNYEKVEKHLKVLIAKKFKTGEKLPSMSQLAEALDVSSNTIRKALQNLAGEDIVRFERGRYGGTFVTRIPEVQEEKSFAWVSINPETIKSYRKSTSGQEVTN